MFNNVLLITLQSLQLLNFNNHNATEAISAIVHQNFIAATVRERFSPRFTVRLISQTRFASSENLSSVGRAGIHVQLKQVPLPRYATVSARSRCGTRLVGGCRGIKAAQCKPQAPFVPRKPVAGRWRALPWSWLYLLYFCWHGTRHRRPRYTMATQSAGKVSQRLRAAACSTTTRAR